MDQIYEKLWIGDASDGRNVETLKSSGITAVFNATAETDNWPAEFKEKTPYLRLNQDDGATIPIAKLAAFLEWMIAQRRDDRSVLIHCGAGVSRASSFTIAWLMFCGMSWDKAEETVRQARPIISPHGELKRSILQFFERWPHDGTYNEG